MGMEISGDSRNLGLVQTTRTCNYYRKDEEEVDSVICEHVVGLAGFCYLNIYSGYYSHPALSLCKSLTSLR